MLLLLLLLHGFVLVAIVAMGWKESLGSPDNNHERTEAHQGMEFQLHLSLCLAPRTRPIRKLLCATGQTRKEDRFTTLCCRSPLGLISKSNCDSHGDVI